MSSTLETVRSSVASYARHAGWAMALRGVAAIVFGIIALRNPNIAAGAFVILFAVYSFADGILDFGLAASLGRAGERWGWYLLAGIASIALGVIALAYPGATVLAIVMLIGIYAIVHGILEIVAALSWGIVESRWLLALTGILGIVFGFLLLGSPGAGAIALLWTVGVFAIIYGIALLIFGVRVLSEEHHESQVHGGSQRAAAAAG